MCQLLHCVLHFRHSVKQFLHSKWKISYLANCVTQPAVVMVVANFKDGFVFSTWLYSRANPVLVVGLGVAEVMCTPRMNGCCRPGGDSYHQHLGFYNHHDQS